MNTLAVGVCLMGDDSLDLDSFAMATGADTATIRLWVDEALLTPALAQPQWRFGGEELARARRILRLQRDFDANVQSVAVMLQLLDEIDALQAQLRRHGLAFVERR